MLLLCELHHTGLESYVTEAEDISSTYIDFLSQEAVDLVNSTLVKTGVESVCKSLTGHNSTYRSHEWEIADPSISYIYFLTVKDGFSNQAKNYCVVILNVHLTIVYDGGVMFDKEAYYAVTYTNLIADKKGNISVSLPSATISKINATFEELYTAYITKNKAEYRVNEIKLGEKE